MHEIEITCPPELDEQQERIAKMHSILNVLNVICLQIGELALVNMKHANRFFAHESEVALISQKLHTGKEIDQLQIEVQAIRQALQESLDIALQTAGSVEQIKPLATSKKALNAVFEILRLRLDEYSFSRDQPDTWDEFSIDSLKHEIQDLFKAIEKNAKGRYKIRYNLEKKQPNDYLIDLNISSTLVDGKLWMPFSLKDIFRDLLANARKYTTPGGNIRLEVLQDKTSIKCTINDNGMGIPKEELSQVANYGYRASNANAVRTLGGGFGLTKSVWLVLRWGGRFFIASELDTGTRVRFEIPNKRT